MSAPTSRPAVVVVGPKSEFSIAISSKRAPVAAASCASSGGMIAAPIAVPVTTPMRRPSRRGSAPSPSAMRSRSARHRPDTVLDLRESRRRTTAAGSATPGEQVQLVGTVHPALAALRPSARDAQRST